MKLYAQQSRAQETYVNYILLHPGCSKADVDRACRVNPRAGHKWVYDGVTRLQRQGIIVDSGKGNLCKLYVAKWANELLKEGKS